MPKNIMIMTLLLKIGYLSSSPGFRDSSGVIWNKLTTLFDEWSVLVVVKLQV